MEELVEKDNNFAVHVHNVSRLFFNTAGKPISAVNCVSLGVRKGSTFGFLGANGAGKTTLIKMITSMLPPSNGTIQIMGVDISHFNDPTLLSVCPQFNSHLCQELTPREHFYLYSKLFQSELPETVDRFVEVLELKDVFDKPIRDLSDGEVRKLSIALSFFGPAEIILLDEPTASLDPVARHHVHEMISELKGKKTFMLCTYLLSEAESTYDYTSIMLNICVHNVESRHIYHQNLELNFILMLEYLIKMILHKINVLSFSKENYQMLN
jgi:ABC-type multidrug transport system ATPase subunit